MVLTSQSGRVAKRRLSWRKGKEYRYDMLVDYLRAAMGAAHYELLSEEEGFYGEIPGFEGVFADGNTLETCREELASTLEDWLLFRISRNLQIPTVNGLDLAVKEVAEIQ